jgi:hypothetical protein
MTTARCGGCCHGFWLTAAVCTPIFFLVWLVLFIPQHAVHHLDALPDPVIVRYALDTPSSKDATQGHTQGQRHRPVRVIVVDQMIQALDALVTHAADGPVSLVRFVGDELGCDDDLPKTTNTNNTTPLLTDWWSYT